MLFVPPVSRLMRLLLAVATAMMIAPTADAQSSAVCRQLQAQLNSAGRGNGAAAQRQQAELNRTVAYYQSLGCGGFFQPGECRGLQARIGQMQSNLAQLSQGGGVDRGAIMAALQANGCTGGGRQQVRAPQPQMAPPPAAEPVYPSEERAGRVLSPSELAGGGSPQSAYRVQEAPRGGFFESLFGGRREAEPVRPEVVPMDEQPRILEEDRRPRFSGSRLVCVRTCDGAFAPLNTTAGMRDPDDLQDLCALQCPGAETQLYRVGSDGEIENATNFDGGSYMAMPNALAFRKRFDKTCTCRPQTGTWAEAMVSREDLTLRPGDQIVSPEQARLMSLPPAQRAAASKQLQAEANERREADRAARLERRKARAAGRVQVGIDGVARPAEGTAENGEPMRGSIAAPQTIAPPPATIEPPVAVEPQAAEPAKPVRVIPSPGVAAPKG